MRASAAPIVPPAEPVGDLPDEPVGDLPDEPAGDGGGRSIQPAWST
ncbi:hypothetical protein ABN034_16650 [Actinopolymorpha sp. B11F2]